MGLIQNKVTVSQPNSHVVVKNAGGLRGLTGEQGVPGPQGEPGEAATVTAGTTTTLPAGSDATVQNVGSTSAAIFNFGIPKGDKGDTGETGAAATISVGSTSILPAGSSATVTNSGTSSAAVFDFGIPKGDKGDTGATGADGYSPSATVTKTGDTATITITDKDGTTTASISDGSTPTVNDGTLTIQKNGTTVQTFSADQASNVTANITVPTQLSELSGTVSSSQIEDEAITTGTVSGTGTNITLAGTMEGGAIESVELNGDTTQTTYSGKNLYQSIGKSTVSGGLISTITSNGEFHVTGTASDSSSTFSTTMDTSLPAGSYVLSITKTLPFNILLRASNNQNIGVITAGNKSVTITTTTTLTSLWVWAYPLTNGTAYDETFGVQLESGSTATSFEPYVGGTASPNPDYPQEVQTVTGEQTVTVVGKNLLNESAMEQGTFSYIDGYESAHTGVIRMDSYMRCQPNTTYTLSSDSVLGEVGVVYKDSSGNVVQGFSKGAETITSYSFTTQPNVYQMRVRVGKGAYPHTAGVDYKLQLELGNQPTSYQPYQGGSYPINLGKNLLNPATFVKGRIDSGVVGYVSDTSALSNTENTITFTTTANYRGAASDFIAVDAETQYRLQQQLQSGTTNYIDFYDTSKTWISRATSNPFTTPQDCGYVRVSYQGNSAGTYTVTNPQLEKGSAATPFAPYFTPIELCKIGTYQDYIYKSGEDWYVHKEIGKYTLDGSLAWYESGSCFKLTNLNTDLGYAPMNAGYVFYPATDSIGLWCNYGIAKSGYKVFQGTEKGVGLGVGGTGGGGADGIYVTGGSLTLANFQTILNTSPLVCDYILETPTDTQITNATLISELEGLLSATTYSGTTYITVSGDLASPLEVVAEADSKLAPDSVYGAAIKDGAVSVDKIADLKALADALAPYLNS